MERRRIEGKPKQLELLLPVEDAKPAVGLRRKMVVWQAPAPKHMTNYDADAARTAPTVEPVWWRMAGSKLCVSAHDLELRLGYSAWVRTEDGMPPCTGFWRLRTAFDPVTGPAIEIGKRCYFHLETKAWVIEDNKWPFYHSPKWTRHDMLANFEWCGLAQRWPETVLMHAARTRAHRITDGGMPVGDILDAVVKTGHGADGRIDFVAGLKAMAPAFDRIQAQRRRYA